MSPEAELTPDLHGLLSRVPAILYIADLGAEGRWHYASPQIEDILGYTAEEWCAQPGMWEQRLHPEDRDRVLRLEAAAEAGAPEAGISEYRLLHRDGHPIWVQDEAAIVQTTEGSRWHGVVSDVSERKQAEAELELRAAQQSAVAQLGEHALQGATPSELMQEALSAAAEILKVQLAAVMELQEGGSLLMRAGCGWPEEMIGTSGGWAGTRSSAGYAIVNDQPVVVSDWESEERFECPVPLVEAGVRSGLTVPIEGREQAFGAIALQCTEQREFSAGDISFAQALANVLADALQRQATDDDVRHRALHDPLTGLPNRVLFLDRVEQALSRTRRRGAQAAVLFLDLDHFKLINDTMGHGLGDELLSAVGERLRDAVRPSDTVARFGGDEFGVLLEEIDDPHIATDAAERVGGSLTKPFALAGSEQFVSASIGIAIATGGETGPELIRDADAAMYRAKDHGRARYELFDEVMRARAVSRLRVENDLRRAVDRVELLLHYQPIVSLADNRICGVEALLRWNHPQGGLVPTRDFIPIAEENGMIEPIGEWVLRRACEQAARWYRARPDSAPITLSVNLSPVQVAKPSFPDLIADVLRRSGLDPACLFLEITETVMLREDHALMDVLNGLKRLGVRLMLDDFGTGYSSLSYLNHLPLDALKIDRSFVDGLGTEARESAITHAIVAMAKALGLLVVGEGVEEEVQAHELRRAGCDMAQGYWFCRPTAPAEITKMLSADPALLPVRD